MLRIELCPRFGRLQGATNLVMLNMVLHKRHKIRMEMFDRIAEEIGEEIVKGGKEGGIVQSESGQKFFLKCGPASNTYRCEANGLKELSKCDDIKIANVASVGEEYILTHYIEEGRKEPNFFQNFGRAFARLHKIEGEHFGFYEDNFIGENPQPNLASESEKEDWVEFFFNKRLLYQYRMAEEKGYIDPTTAKQFVEVERRLPKVLANSVEKPTLLHGDLWGGNYLTTPEGSAILIDPAVYYGHREADIAMTYLFGGFTREFYTFYNREYPLADGWIERLDIYKLYHTLNHLNIFGRSYLGRCEAIIARYAGSRHRG